MLIPTSKDFTYTRALYTYLHQPKAGPVPLALPQPFHAGGGSHRHLSRAYWGPPAWQSRWVNERGKPASQKPLNPEDWVRSCLPGASYTQHMWELLAGNRTVVLPRHARGRWITSYQYIEARAHVHQPTAWPLSHACPQPYHAGSGSHGPPFRPYWGSSARHSSRSETKLDPFLPRRVL